MTDEFNPIEDVFSLTGGEAPRHVPGQINLEGDVEEKPPVPADPEGPRDYYTNTERDAAAFERMTR